MAIIEYGPLVSRVAGKVGGVTFRGNGSRGIVQASGRKGGQASPAQERQRQYIRECRASYDGLDGPDRRSFDFSVSEGYQMRKETGGRYGSGLEAYTAWYTGRRYMQMTTTAPTMWQLARTIGPWDTRPVSAWVAGGVDHLRVYYNYVLAVGWACWLSHGKSVDRLPGRASWTLIYPWAGDPEMVATSTGLPGPKELAYEFGPYVADRVSGFLPGSVWGVRFVCSTGGWAVQRSPVIMTAVGTTE
jgi:hypothetical protein